MFRASIRGVSDQILTQVSWWGGNVLEALLVVRAIRGRFFGRYPIFYGYLSYVFAYSIAAFCIYAFRPAAYSTFYWSLQYVSVGVGYCVIWEIYRQVFKPYPGASRMTRNLLPQF